MIKGRLLPARIGLTITKTGNAPLATWHPHFHSVPFNLRYVLKSLENRLHVLVVDQVQHLLCPKLCSPFEKELQSFQFKPALCLACQRCVCQSGQVKLEGGAEAEALWRSRWKTQCAKKKVKMSLPWEEQIRKYTTCQKKSKLACLGRADYHWGEVKAVDPKSCHSGHLKKWGFSSSSTVEQKF